LVWWRRAGFRFRASWLLMLLVLRRGRAIVADDTVARACSPQSGGTSVVDGGDRGGQGQAGRPWFEDTWTKCIVHQCAAFWRLFDLSMEIRLTLIARLARVPDMHEHLLWRFQRPRPASGRRAGAASQ
jgi:hypothetical protein